MSHVIPLSKINQYLPKGKLQVAADQHDDWVRDLESTAWDIVRSKLSVLYNVSTWDGSVTTTPSLVVTITGMLTAGWLYDRQFSEEVATGISYGARKVREAYSLLDSILDGTYVLDGVEVILDPSKLPSTLITEPVFIMEERY